MNIKHHVMDYLETRPIFKRSAYYHIQKERSFQLTQFSYFVHILVNETSKRAASMSSSNFDNSTSFQILGLMGGWMVGWWVHLDHSVIGLADIFEIFPGSYESIYT